MSIDKAALQCMSRSELQRIAKTNHVKANKKSPDIIEELVRKYPDGVPSGTPSPAPNRPSVSAAVNRTKSMKKIDTTSSEGHKTSMPLGSEKKDAVQEGSHSNGIPSTSADRAALMDIPDFLPMSGTASTAHFRSRKATAVVHEERRPFGDIFPKWRDTAVERLGSRNTDAEGSRLAAEAAAAEPVETGRPAPSEASAPRTYEKVFSPPRRKDSLGELDALSKRLRPQVPIQSAPTSSSVVSEEKREQARHRLATLSYVEGENILEILLDVSKMHKYLKLMHLNMDEYADELVERGQEVQKEGRELMKRGEKLKGYVQSSMKYLSASDAGVEALDRFFCDSVPGEDIPEGALMEHGNFSYQSSDDFTTSTAMDTEDVKGKRKASFEDYDYTDSFSPMKRSRIQSDPPSGDEVE